MEINQIIEKIKGCAVEVHKRPGPGLLEFVYEDCLSYEDKAVQKLTLWFSVNTLLILCVTRNNYTESH